MKKMLLMLLAVPLLLGILPGSVNAKQQPQFAHCFTMAVATPSNNQFIAPSQQQCNKAKPKPCLYCPKASTTKLAAELGKNITNVQLTI
jgi:hypothetical protein